jgi:hypothetical protein
MGTEQAGWMTRLWWIVGQLRYLWHPWVRLAFCWIVALFFCAGTLYFPANWFPDRFVQTLHLREGSAWNCFEVKGYDLRLLAPLHDPSDIPTVGNYLIVIVPVDGVLHFRIFDSAGEVIEDRDETNLKDKAGEIDTLRKAVQTLGPPHELTRSEKDRVVTQVNSILDRRLEMAHPKGTRGHFTIDFGGQYLMGRLVATGNGRSLYDRKVQRQVLAETYECDCRDPRTEKKPDETKPTDAESLLSSTISDDSPEGTEMERGGSLYPPVHALLYSPLGFLPPLPAYRIVQVLHIVLTILFGVLIQLGTRGRVWAPVAIVAILYYPGYSGSINLGQNSLLTLVLLGLGWYFLARGRPVLGGIFWGLLAFKPVWAMAFLLVPLLTGRWRFLLSMCATGAVLILLTLPFVGVQAWFDWLAVGKAADKIYVTDENWVHLSRDVQGLGRRMLAEWPRDKAITYRYSESDRYGEHFGERLYVMSGTIPYFLILGLTLLVGLAAAVRRWRRGKRLRAVGLTAEPERTEGPGAAFLLLGSWLACWHFMYYDLLPSALAVGVLFAAPGRYLRPVFLWRRDESMPEDLQRFHGLSVRAPTLLYPEAWQRRWVSNPFGLVLVVALMLVWPVGTLIYDVEGLWRSPVDTWLLILLWGWCGWLWLTRPDFLAERSAGPLSTQEQAPLSKDENDNEGEERLSDEKPIPTPV